jgi:hypothetical protein
MTPPHPQRRYPCRYCSAILPAWLPVAKRPEASMLLYHLGQHHPEDVGFPIVIAKFCMVEDFLLVEEALVDSLGKRGLHATLCKMPHEW